MNLSTQQALQHCTVCPRNCGADRISGKVGFCGAGTLPKVALVSAHQWEEPPISGTRGSGTVFFSHCNLRCVFCQNHDISQENFGAEISIERLTEIFLEQQSRGLHNINLVSASHFIPQIAEALENAKAQGLSIPVVYNSNGYESLDGLRMLDGLVDVYLPDFKYWDDTLAVQYSKAPHYAETTAAAILEMRRQTKADIFDENGILRKGLILRHLVLPGHYKDSFRVLDWIRENLGKDAYVSLLNQYTPMYHATEFRNLSRRLTTFEYDKVTEYFLEIGLTNGFVQKRSAATSEYTPLFDLSGVKSAATFQIRKEN